MWYDKYQDVPARGSPLETVFLLVHLQRQEAELLATRSLVRGQFATLIQSADAAKSAYEAYQAYADAMFPFLEQAANQPNDDHKRLLEHVKFPMRINTDVVARERAAKNRASALAMFKAREKR